MATAVSTITEQPSTNSTTICSILQAQYVLPLDIVSLLSSLISLLAIFLALFFIILFKRWTFLNQRLILYLCIATIVSLVANMLSRISQREFCVFAGFVNQIGGWMALNAYVSITLSLIIRVFFTRQFKRPDMWVIVFIFGTPFWFNWIPFIRNSYGQSGIACWIKYNEIVNGTCQIFKFGQALELVLWYIPLYLMLGIMIILYTIVLVKFYFHRRHWVRFDQNKDNERRNAINYVTSLLAYPLIYLLANVIPLISRFYSFTNPTNYPFVLFIIAIVLYTQQGTGIAIAVLVNLRKKLTYPSLKAAMSGWCHREATVKEYPIAEGETEPDDDDYDDDEGPSVSYKLYSDSKPSVKS